VKQENVYVKKKKKVLCFDKIYQRKIGKKVNIDTLLLLECIRIDIAVVGIIRVRLRMLSEHEKCSYFCIQMFIHKHKSRINVL